MEGRRRKYYKITASGLETLNDEKAQWKIVNTTLGNIWGDSLCLT